MKTRICSVKIIPALWFSLCALGLMVWAAELSAANAATPAKKKKAAPRKKAAPVPTGPVTLASLVRAYRQAPTPARRAEVVRYAAAHPKEAPLANLALGVAAWEQKDFATAIASFQKVNGKLPQIADYMAYYSAASRVENNDGAGAVRDLQPLRATEVPSPLAGRSRVVEARALKMTQPADAVRVLRDHYGELPQPDGDLALGECDQAAGDLPGAAEAYQRVYYQYPVGDAATRAAAALLALKDAMADRYPQPAARLLLRRADRLMDLRDLSHARVEFQALLDRPPSLERDQARVRMGAVGLLCRQNLHRDPVPGKSGCGRIRGRCGAPLLPGGMPAPPGGRPGNGGEPQAAGGKTSQFAVAPEGADVGGQSLFAGEPSGRLCAPLQGGLSDLRH